MNVQEQLLRLKDIQYPAKIVMGRVTNTGVLVLDDYPHLANDVEAATRLAKYLKLEEMGGMKYRYEFASLPDVEATVEKMRAELIEEAQARERPKERRQ